MAQQRRSSVPSVARLACGRLGCAAVFADTRQLRNHKAAAHADVFCRRCDLDFPDADALLRHKATSASDIHIACPKCGVESSSTRAREQHIAKFHPDEKAEVRCAEASCGRVFRSASALVRHFELDECPVVSSADFQLASRRKHIARRMMEDPGRLEAAISRWVRQQDGAPAPPSNSTERSRGGQQGELVRAALVDPTSLDYNVQLFHDPADCRYSCPYPRCHFADPDPEGLTQHLDHEARPSDLLVCPGANCQKRFRQSSALVAHLEAPGAKCTAKQRGDYGDFVSDATGGYISAALAPRTDVGPFLVARRITGPTGKKRKDTYAWVRLRQMRHEAYVPDRMGSRREPGGPGDGEEEEEEEERDDEEDDEGGQVDRPAEEASLAGNGCRFRPLATSYDEWVGTQE